MLSCWFRNCPICEMQLLTDVNGVEPNHIVFFHVLYVYFTKDNPKSEHT